MQATHVMIDLETLATVPNAIILSLGAVVFDPYAQSDFDEVRSTAFYSNIDRDDCERRGLVRDLDTEAWWARQTDAARAALLDDPRPLDQALGAFALWYSNQPYKITTIWAKSPSFDCVILQSAFRAVGKRCPWMFFAERDVRTLQDIAYPDGDRPRFFGDSGVVHDARDDATAQALMVQACYQRLGRQVLRESALA